MKPAPITPALIKEVALANGFAPAALRAIMAVETGGAGYDARTGKLLIQFEPAYFKNLLPNTLKKTVSVALAAKVAGKATTDQAALAANWTTVLANRVESQGPERTAFNAAWAIDPVTAMRSTSWGLPQIMGEHFKRIGYPTVNAMVDAFRDGGEAEQLRGLCAFLATDKRLATAVKALDWATVAYLYNGKNYKVNNYDVRLKKAYDTFVTKP
jgi:hypothetical protein